ncbi:collagen binding domain-containing protein [Dactylosporangium sp. NPDC051541]|uniref:collagen binding domain-containing protein n=1 Tax=Dactylosporangium sp. NPDC051541 TaxID=3363977 RepID=UPI0037B7B0FB
MFIRPRRLARTLVLGLAVALSLTPAAAHADSVTIGSVAGTLTDGTVTVADAGVDLLLLPYGVAIKQTSTDTTGAFRFADVSPQTYALRFRLPGGLVQFHPSVAEPGSAAPITVAAGAETTVHESVMPHGTLGGRITTDSGRPASGARVQVYPITGGSPLATVLTGANGAYQFGYPPSGQVRVAVAAAERGATIQWAYRQRSYTQANPVTVTAGQHTTVNERLFPSGAIVGRFTRNGIPVPNVVVYAYSQTNTAESVSNWTAADGTFRLSPYPGSYTVKFVVPSGTGLDQWLGGAESQSATRPVRVNAGQTVFVDERQRLTGLVRGRLTDAAGQPSAGSAVVVYDTARGRQFEATTADDGTWFVTTWPGTYAVRFETETQVQWATGKRSSANADPVVVAANGTTVVDDALLP